MPNCWVKRLWKYCWEYNINLVDDMPVFQKAREGDQFIMEAFLQAGYAGEQLRLLNYCRCWCKAITLADLATANGAYLHPRAMTSSYKGFTYNTVEWNRDPPALAPKFWIIWKQALEKCFTRRHEGNR